jgi:DNA polymerase-3 subunit epsilon
MRGEDLVRLAAARIRDRRGIPVLTDDVDPSVWLRCDSFGLTQGLSYLACRLVDELEVPELHLRVGTHERFARIDLLWRGKPMSSETAATWELDAFELGGETGNASLREVIDRHRGEVWFQRERASHSLYFRLLVPLAATRAAAQPAALASRPEFYDFDLFGAGSLPRELEERPLASLACTVFDTETTGLDPSGGDEVVSIAAVRIVNGRLLSDDTFEQLVDPGRGMPPASIAIHGITDEMVAGQPTIAEVLPRFHRFAQDTVLVAHNSAFDMRFLQLKEQATGVAFRQPVLDTLLLSQVAHPGQPDHGLEDIARRLGVDVVGRHTALGDALVTAEVFLRLLAALEARGIRTLGQAREASAKTYYAKVSY